MVWMRVWALKTNVIATYRHPLSFHVGSTEDFIELWFLIQNCLRAGLDQLQSTKNSAPRFLKRNSIIRAADILKEQG